MGINLEDSPLYQSVIKGNVDNIRTNLDNKIFSWDIADDDEDDYIFRNALRKAIELDRKDIVEVMFQAHFGDNEYGFGNWKRQYVAEALETAARLGKQEIVQQIIATEKDNIRTISNALAHGVWSRNLQILKILVDAGASSNCETDWGTPLIAASSTGDLKVVQFLVEAGADPTMWVDLDGYVSPLIAAADAGHEEIFEYLLPLVTDEEEIEAARKELSRRGAGRKWREHL
jgi:hypothetical protein